MNRDAYIFDIICLKGYNIILIPIAMGFFYPINNFKMDPMYAAVAMAMSSISVVTSSLFLKLYNPNHVLK